MEYPFLESKAADRAGVSRQVMKRIRDEKLQETKHYKLVDGAIALSEAGLQVVLVELDLVSQKNAQNARGSTQEMFPKEDVAAAEKKPVRALLPAQAGLAREVVTGVVIHKYKNTKVLGVRLAGGNVKAPLVRLRVRRNKNFVRGMEVPMRLIQKPDLYELTRKEPRWRGKW